MTLPLFSESGESFGNIGFIGAGHIAGYMLRGLLGTGQPLTFTLADPDPLRRRQLRETYGCDCFQENQKAVTDMDLVILAVRPIHLEAALEGVCFFPGQVVASVVAGAGLDRLTSLVAPATVVRVLPIASAAVNRGPVLIHPPCPPLETLFARLGRVHFLEDEAAFTPGTALVGAFFAWIIPLVQSMVQWAQGRGIDPAMARDLVVETMEGACAMVQDKNDLGLEEIWQTLATPGGISQKGAEILEQEGAFQAFCTALEGVTWKMKAEDEKYEDMQ